MAPGPQMMLASAAVVMSLTPALSFSAASSGLSAPCSIKNIGVRNGGCLALRGASHTSDAAVDRRQLLGAGIAASVPLFVAGGKAEAKGQFAKIEVGKMVDDYVAQEKKGPSLYDAEADKVIKERLVKIDREWAKMTKEVDAALSKKLCNEAKGSLGLRMGTIKQAMREVSRLAAGGDVLVRDNGEGRAANFDFSTGTFTYKSIAQVPEDMFAGINRLVEDCRIKDQEAANEEWVEVKSGFAKWKEMLNEILSERAGGGGGEGGGDGDGE